MTTDQPNNCGKFYLLFFLLLFGVGTEALNAQTVYALSGPNLISFDAQTPSLLTSNTPITGLLQGHALMGLDFRPATGQLYALGYNSVNAQAELYIIDRNTAVGTPIGAPVTLASGIADFGFDFNPTVDRIRVTGDNNSNYRLHPVTGALVATDGNLAFAAGDVNVGVDPSIGAVAYTNSYIASPSTILYNYDYALNILTTQNPPNNGTLNTVGSSGLTLNIINKSVDLDIYFDPATGTNKAFLTANTGASVNDNFYTINLASGLATLVGPIGSGEAVRDIAVLINAAVPPTLSGDLIFALTGSNSLITFDSEQPGFIRSIDPVTGIAAGQVLTGLDFRPATGQLYTLGYNAANGEARLYTIDTITGVATPVGAGPATLAMNMSSVGFDFNPTVDRIRVTSSNNNNYRMHPVTGALAFTDANLAYAAGDVNVSKDPYIGTVAYLNSFAGTLATTLYDYDDSLNIIATQTPPNNGTLNTVGASGITVNLADPSSDMDIHYDLGTGANRAYLAANVDSSITDNFYKINLATGAATLVGKIGLGVVVKDIAAVVRPLAINCTADIVDTLPAGASGMVVNYALPIGISSCSNDSVTITLVSGPASGDTLSAGVTQVCYVATDSCGNSDTCCFTITLNMPDSPLSLNCTADIVDTLPFGVTNMVVNYVLPTATTTCSSDSTATVTLVSGPASGAAFSSGVTTVCYAAADSCGNSDTCCFTVTLNLAPPAQITLTCPTNITDSLPAGASSMIVNYTIPTASTTCPGFATVSLLSGPASGTAFQAGSTDVCYMATDFCGNADTCCFTVMLIQDTAGDVVITCPADIFATLPTGDTSMVVNYALPTAVSTCALDSVTVTLLSGPASGDTVSFGVTQVCYVAVDFCGHADTCCFTIALDIDTTGSELSIQCPADIVDTLAAGNTSMVINYPLPFAITSCSIDTVVVATLLSGPPSGSIFNVGVTQVCYISSDSCGNIDTCCFSITLNPAPPVVTFSCQGNTTINAFPGADSTVFNYTFPTATSTCSSGGVTVTLLSGPASGGMFAVGSNQVCFVGIDSCGSTDTCCYNVIVNAVPPGQVTVTCPANVTATGAAGALTAVVNYTLPTATTTCPLGGTSTVTLLSGSASGAAFPGGNTQVCYVAKDSCNNLDTCCFNVNVVLVPSMDTACDVKTIGCMRFEVIRVKRDSVGDEIYRMRVTNNCTSPLNYVVFEVPQGFTAISPTNTSGYMAPSGRTYRVRNPNSYPYNSIRFKADSMNIFGGQSDIFEYKLPKITDPLFVHSFARLKDGTGYEVILNLFDCAVLPYPIAPPIIPNQPEPLTDRKVKNGTFSLSPNPTSGIVSVDLSDWTDQRVVLTLHNALGKDIMRIEMEGGFDSNPLELPGSLASGLYYVSMTAPDGTRLVKRLVIQR